MVIPNARSWNEWMTQSFRLEQCSVYFVQVGTNCPLQRVQVWEIAGDCRCFGAWKTHCVPLFAIVGDAGQDSCPKKSKAESGSRLWISIVDNKELLADQAWRLCGFVVDWLTMRQKLFPLKLASVCSEAFPKRTLKECYFQGLYLWEADWSTSNCSRKQWN